MSGRENEMSEATATLLEAHKVTNRLLTEHITEQRQVNRESAADRADLHKELEVFSMDVRDNMSAAECQ